MSAPRRASFELRAKAYRSYKNGESFADIAERLGASRTWLSHHIEQQESVDDALAVLSREGFGAKTVDEIITERSAAL
jgi:transposase-like protein